jgi:plastocyanin
MGKISLVVTLLVFGALSAAKAAGARTASQRDHPVLLKNIQIHPSTLRIRHGDTVTWTWGDAPIETERNVTSFGKRRFRSSSTQMVGTYTVKFGKKGTYDYHCTIHPTAMEGKIIVR